VLADGVKEIPLMIPPVQLYEVAPLAVNVADAPEQITGAGFVTETEGIPAVTESVIAAEAAQLTELVATKE
jgi:hypothetical protein